MIVLDCSGAIEIARGTALGRAFKNLMLSDELVVAPMLFYAETANAYWKYAQAGLLSFNDARAYVARTIRLVDEFYRLDDMIDEVFAEAVHLKHSAYDLFYLVLARRHAATLLTADRKLAELCTRMHVNCIELVDF